MDNFSHNLNKKMANGKEYKGKHVPAGTSYPGSGMYHDAKVVQKLHQLKKNACLSPLFIRHVLRANTTQPQTERESPLGKKARIY